MMRSEIDRRSSQHHRRGEDHADLQQPPHDHFHAAIVEAARIFFGKGNRSHSVPIHPLTIISTPRDKITSAKIVLRIETRARGSSLAPASDPASTPSITGAASPGTTYPRL